MVYRRSHALRTGREVPAIVRDLCERAFDHSALLRVEIDAMVGYDAFEPGKRDDGTQSFDRIARNPCGQRPNP